jgi:cytosine/adenosine deaminase-related metal-dependent hydrolase
MVRIALAPCSPFSVSPELMTRTAELAERLDVRLHTHLAENAEDVAYSMERFGRRPIDQFAEVGWLTDRSWAAHVVHVDEDEIRRLGAAGVGVAHCPSSNMILASGLSPTVALRAAGSPVGIGCDGSSSADAASLWQEARLALLQGKLVAGADAVDARRVLEMATRDGAACLGRADELGQIAVGCPADLAVWRMDGPAFAGAIDDPVEAWLRCGPLAATHTVVAGHPIVVDGNPVTPRLADLLEQHRVVARRFQQA